MTRSPPTARSGPTLRDLAALRAGMLLVDSAPLAEMQQAPRPARRAGPQLSATARAKCSRCRPGATRISPPRERYIDMIATDAETPPGARARAEVLSALIRRRRQELRIVHAPSSRIVLLAALVALAPALAGCENIDMDKLDVFGLTKKKPLPGERKPLFPQGVPGVTQGIPPEYMKVDQPQRELRSSRAPQRRRQHRRDSAGASRQAAAPRGRQDGGGRAGRKPKPKPKPNASSASRSPSRNAQARKPAPAAAQARRSRRRTAPAPGRVSPAAEQPRPHSRHPAPRPGRRRRRRAHSRTDAKRFMRGLDPRSQLANRSLIGLRFDRWPASNARQ